MLLLVIYSLSDFWESIGAAGTVIDDAAYQWDGDARYGYGDYRIPKYMLTFPNASRMDPPANKGIVHAPCHN